MKRILPTIQNKSILRVLLIALILPGIFQACRKDKDPLSNLTGISSFSIKGFEDYTFTINQNALTISNTDSLPFLTDPSAMVANFELIPGSTVKVNGVEQESGVTTNNFTNEVTYVTTAEDGITSRSYKVKVNIAQIDPNTVAWQRMVENSSWGPYSTSNVGYFNNSFWAFGAQSGLGGALTSGTFKSTDGAAWTSVTTSTTPMPFASRQTAVFGFQNIMWLFGGLVPPLPLEGGGSSFAYVTNEIWSSGDGTTWTKTARVAAPTAGQLWTGRERIPMVVFQDKLWIVGGNGYPGFGNPNAPGTPLNDVWSSTNGTTWTEVLPNLPNPENARFLARTAPAVFVHNNRIYVAGGRNSSGTLLNDIWTSTNGSTWTKLTVTAPFDAVWGHQIVSYNGQLFLVGGYVKNESNADVVQNVLWISEDNGATWAKALAGDPRALPGNFPGRAFFSMFVHNNAIWIVGGEYQTAPNVRAYYNDTWKGALVK